MAQDFEGVADAYKPPAIDYDAAPNVASGGAFYVVAIPKLVILYIATFGVYAVYWFYKNWRLQKFHYGLDIWPVARAVFAIFFVHRLFTAIDMSAREKSYTPAWDPRMQATLYVVLAVAGRLVGRFGGDAGALSLVSIAVAMVSVVPLYSAQKVANLACGDAEGESNRTLTAGNVVAILLGVAFWGLIILGATMSGDSLSGMREAP